MLTGQLLDQAIAIATAQGFEVRYEHLGGTSTGYCQVGQLRWIMIDVTQPIDEQLEQVAEAIASTPLPSGAELSPELRAAIENIGRDVGGVTRVARPNTS